MRLFLVVCTGVVVDPSVLGVVCLECVSVCVVYVLYGVWVLYCLLGYIAPCGFYVLCLFCICDRDTSLAVFERLCVFWFVCEGRSVICVWFCLCSVPHSVCGVRRVNCSV